ncbi:hypothetical protein [Shimia sp.]|uniref:hypothetical protein n=1 Tax=Shimia sp. TaxID=1954381 RepID=UPI003B8B0AA5
MDQITGLQEMRFLAQSGGDAARLASLARAMGVLTEDADPTIAEWEACLLELRRKLSGPRISAELTCPECSEGVALIFGIDDLPHQAPNETLLVEEVALKPLRLSDLEAIEKAPGDRLSTILTRASGNDTNWADQQLSGPKRDHILKVLERALVGLDLQLGTQCTECSAEIVSSFDVQAFVMAERSGSAKHLLDQVHLMASTYHWSESEILALTRDRRRAYLDRIERDALQIEVSDVRY